MLRIAIILILAAFEINSVVAQVTVTVTGPSKPLVDVETKYACEADGASQYTWAFTGTNTFDTKLKTKELTGKITAAGAVNITCTPDDGTHGGTAGSLPVTAVIKPVKPTITQSVGVRGKFQKGGAYTLTCNSESYAPYADKATWSWTKNNQPITPSDKAELEISSATTGGEYKCTITIATLAESSDPLVVEVTEKLGLNCVSDPDCAGLAANSAALYTGKCKASRCECAAGANPKPESCGTDSSKKSSEGSEKEPSEDTKKGSGKDSGTPSLIASLSMTLTVAMVMIERLL